MQQVHHDEERDYLLDSVMEKVVRVLLENPAIPYNKKQLAEAANVSRNALYRRWDTLVRHELVKEADVGAAGTFWVLNEDTDAANALVRLLYDRE